MAGPGRSRRRRRFTLIVLILASLTILTINFRSTGPVQAVGRVTGSVFAPVRDAAAWVGHPFANLWDSAFHYSEVKRDNQALQRRVDELEARKVHDQIDQRLYRQLLAQADITYLDGLPSVAAQVTSGPLSNFQESLAIDRGSGDGIKVGMAVVTDQGLVGRVATVAGGRAQVQPITDPNLSFFVKVYARGDKEDPGTTGEAHGMGTGRDIRISDGILSNVRVSKRDPVYTSGVSTSTYPPGIPVGTVSTVAPTTDRTQQRVDVNPYVNFDRLSIVRVVLWEPTP
ncbi:MAG TPA: rod shape-determining protein MreC [Acidimicrobiales bacterium]|nr:rod shape-determining protein MreC [Acidimicrobiales bacterium]